MFLRTIVALAVLAVLSSFAWAQGYPSKPAHVIVTFPPGGTPDIYGRVMSAELQKVWNQSVVVENRTGAGGTIGTDYVAKAAPDGYTLLFAADATITIAPHLYSKLPYDPVRDLAPIVNVAAGPFVLMANPAFAPNNVKELIALVQTQPGKVSYASSGAGGQQHLAMEYIRTMAGSMDMIHVPCKGVGQGIADVLANRVPLIFGGLTASIQLTRSGKLKALAVTGPKRAKALPNVPAVAETLPGFDITAWYGFLAPAGTPREIVKRIHDDSVAVIKRPDFLERLDRDGLSPVGNTPEEFAAQIKADLAHWAKIVKAAGARGTIPTDVVAKSPPDGYNLVMGHIEPMVSAVTLYAKNLPYDPVRDFEPVTMVAQGVVVLVTHPAVPVSTAKEFIAYAKQKGDLAYASAGNGTTSHLAGELLKKVTGAPLQHIPYKSAGNALTAVLAGEVPVSFLSPLTAHGQLKAGKVKALAVSSSARFAGAPEIPSAVEAGIPGMEVKLWFGLFAPGKTTRAIILKLNREIGDILRAPETQETFLKQGVAAAPGSPA